MSGPMPPRWNGSGSSIAPNAGIRARVTSGKPLVGCKPPYGYVWATPRSQTGPRSGDGTRGPPDLRLGTGRSLAANDRQPSRGAGYSLPDRAGALDAAGPARTAPATGLLRVSEAFTERRQKDSDGKARRQRRPLRNGSSCRMWPGDHHGCGAGRGDGPAAAQPSHRESATTGTRPPPCCGRDSSAVGIVTGHSPSSTRPGPNPRAPRSTAAMLVTRRREAVPRPASPPASSTHSSGMPSVIS